MNDTPEEAPKKARKNGTKKGLPARLASYNEMQVAQAAEKTTEAWRMRCEGKTITQIAEALGVSGTTAKVYLQRGLEAAREHYTASAMDHVQVVVGQLESIISRWRELADCPAAEGADRAAAIVLRALEQKAKLLGLEGKGAGLVVTQTEQVLDLTEALRSPATREALKRMIAEAEGGAGANNKVSRCGGNGVAPADQSPKL